MNILQVLILSSVEGITEFLPVSSTGHLILAAKLLSIPQTEFVKSFEIIIQLGAILAVVLLYWNTLTQNIRLWKPIIAAFIPTSVIGLALYTIIKTYLIGNAAVTVVMLFVGGVVLIILETYNKRREHTGTIGQLGLKNSVHIGLAQSLSVLPGVSRSAATIIGGFAVGLSRSEAVLFSFFLAIPTMVGAAALDLVKSGFVFSPGEWTLFGVGFVGAFVTALVAVKAFLRFVQTHSLIYFGIYRIVIAVAFGVFCLR